MRIRLKIDPQRQEEAPLPPDELFRRTLIPKHDPVSEFLQPIALYCFCVIMHSHGGKELWESYQRKASDPLAQEAHQETGRLSLSFLSSVALHMTGVLLLIPLFDLIATLQPRTTRLRAPVIHPILVKIPTRVILPKNAGKDDKGEDGAGKGKIKRPESGSDSPLVASKRGVEQPKPSLKSPEKAKDVGKPKPPVIADIQVLAENPDLPKILFWSDQPKVPRMPDSVAATAIRRTPIAAPPPETPEALLAMQAKRLDFKPKLTLDVGALRNSEKKDALERDNAVETDAETVRRNVEMRASVGTGDEAAEGIRLMAISRTPQMQRFLELLPTGQLASLANKEGTTGGAVYSIGDITVAGGSTARYLSGVSGGTGKGTGGGGFGAGDGVGRGNQAGNDSSAKPTIADLLAALELAEPERARTIVHAEDGEFDLVVTQTALSDVFAEAKGMLSGPRVETVYIQVGTAKEWILQYCETVDKNPKKSGSDPAGVFTLEEGAPLSAPFPSITVRPPAPLMPKASYVVIHGYISPKGEFEGMEVVGARFHSLTPMLKPSLSKWRFRPAERDGKPVQVEVLLLIPPVAI